MYETKTKAEVDQFGNLLTSKNCGDNAFRIAKQIKTRNKDAIGDTCIKNDQGSLVFNDSEKQKAWNSRISMEQ